MALAQAVREGIGGGRGKLLSAAVIYGVPLAASLVAVAPMRSGLHVAFDRYPAASGLLNGGGLDLLAETGLRQPAFWAAGFGLFLPALLLSLILGLWAQGGAYAVAASRDETLSPWQAIWPAATKILPKFIVIVLLNAIIWGVVAVLAAIPFAVLHARFKENTDPGPSWHLFLAELATLAILWNLASASCGFAKAATALRLGEGNLAKDYLAGLKFSIKRFWQAETLTWTFFALRAGLFALCVAAVPLAATLGGSVMKWFLFQAALFAMAFIRVAEMRIQVEYIRACQPRPEPAKAVYQPAEADVLSSASL